MIEHPARQTSIMNQAGFTLFEVLVAVVILSIGLLGLAGMQVLGLQNNQSAYYRTLATQQAWDMADRMRANSDGVVDNRYDDLDGSSADPGCISAAGGCDPSQLAQYDDWEWGAQNAALLPEGAGTVCRTSDFDPNACNGNGDMFAVRVSWLDDRAAGGTQTFQFVVRP